MSSTESDQGNKDKDIVNKLQSTDIPNTDNNTPLLGDNPTELLANLSELDNELASGDEYYLNPLVNRNLSTRLDPDTSLDKMMTKILDSPSILTDSVDDFSDIEKSGANITSREMLKMLGLGTGITGSSNYVGDPYVALRHPNNNFKIRNNLNNNNKITLKQTYQKDNHRLNQLNQR